MERSVSLSWKVSFHYTLITAIRTEDESKRIFHTVLSCVGFGVIVFTFFIFF